MIHFYTIVTILLGVVNNNIAQHVQEKDTTNISSTSEIDHLGAYDWEDTP